MGNEAIFPPKVDWAQLLTDLKAHGCSTYRVHRILGVDVSTAQNWARGGEPGYGYGRALLRLHATYCGAALTTRRQAEAEV